MLSLQLIICIKPDRLFFTLLMKMKTTAFVLVDFFGRWTLFTSLLDVQMAWTANTPFVNKFGHLALIITLIIFKHLQQIGTELSDDVLNPSHVPFSTSENETLGIEVKSRIRWVDIEVSNHGTKKNFHPWWICNP